MARLVFYSLMVVANGACPQVSEWLWFAIVTSACGVLLVVFELAQQSTAPGPWRVVAAAVLIALAVLLAQWVPVANQGPQRLFEQLAVASYGMLAFAVGLGLKPSTPARARWTLCVSSAGVVAIFGEILQSILPDRRGLVADLITPSAGIVAGALCVTILLAQAATAGSASRAVARELWAVATVVLALAVLFDRAHLGYPIEVAGLPPFRSRVDAVALVDQSRTWRPLPELPWWKRLSWGNDWFAREASYHTRLREQRVRAGDVSGAASADLLLRQFYSAYLSGVEIPAAVATEDAARPASPIDVGPFYYVVAIDRMTLWLAVVVVVSGLGLSAEIVRWNG